MKKQDKFILRGQTPLRFLVLAAVVGLIAGTARAETTEIVTYYPVSANSGNQHLTSLTVGTGYLNQNPMIDGVALIEKRLGIGTNNPVMPLEVYQADESFVRIWGTGINAAPDNFSGLELGADLPQGGPIDNIWQLAHKRGGGGAINDFQVNYFNGTSWSTKMAFLPSGNVGIGVIAPAERLEIAGNFRLPATTAPGGVPAGVIFSGANRFIHNFGTANFFAGVNAGNFTMTGMRNTAVGPGALASNTTGNSNTAMGVNALLGNTGGLNNTAVGDTALQNNTGGTNNTALGYFALGNNTAGFNSTAVGSSALLSNVTGVRNTAVGYRALYSNTTNDNTAVGCQALEVNTDGSGNTALGTTALAHNTRASNNTAVGFEALWANITGNSNTAVGTDALSSNNSGVENTAVGCQALQTNNGGGNTAMGMKALFSNDRGNKNTAIGHSALSLSTASVDNTAVGYEALKNYNGGGRNTAVGDQALLNTTSGEYNTAIGMGAGASNTTGSNNTFIGVSTNPTVGNLTNATAIGALAQVSASNCMVLGNGVNVGIGTTAPTQRLHVVGRAAKTVGGQLWDDLSDGRLKQNIQPIGGALEKMLQLRGVTFEWKDPAKMGDRPGQHMGMIAQEVEKVFPEWVKQDPEGMKWLSMEGLLPVMIESIKYLHQENVRQRALIGKLEKRIETLERK